MIVIKTAKEFHQSCHVTRYVHHNRNAFTAHPISYPESSGFLVSGWAPVKTLGNSKKNLNFLIGCPATTSIVLPQKSCGNKIPVPQSLYWRPSADQKARGLWVRDCCPPCFFFYAADQLGYWLIVAGFENILNMFSVLVVLQRLPLTRDQSPSKESGKEKPLELFCIFTRFQDNSPTN